MRKFEQIPPYNPDERFAIIPLFPHQQPPASSIMHGSLNCVMERIVDSAARSDALDLIERADSARASLDRTRAQESIALARGLQSVNDMMGRLARRMDELELRHADRKRADAEAEAPAPSKTQ
jgi:hypothetical protein